MTAMIPYTPTSIAHLSAEAAMALHRSARLEAALETAREFILTERKEKIDCFTVQDEAGERDMASMSPEDAEYIAEHDKVLASINEALRGLPMEGDDLVIDSFAAVLRAKMADGRLKGRSGWHTCPPERLAEMLAEHVEKADMRDVALFAMMIWWLNQGEEGEGIPFPKPPRRPEGETLAGMLRAAKDEGEREMREKLAVAAQTWLCASHPPLSLPATLRGILTSKEAANHAP